MPCKIEACEIRLTGLNLVKVGWSRAADMLQILDAPTKLTSTLMRHARSENPPSAGTFGHGVPTSEILSRRLRHTSMTHKPRSYAP